jgi:ketosteroid isomerase-like protein
MRRIVMAQAREVLDKLNQALSANETEAVKEYYHENAELVTPEGTYKGRQQIKEYFDESGEAFSDFELNVNNKLESGNKAVDEWSMNMTHSGPLALPGFAERIPATNRHMTLSGADIVTVEDGLIKSHHVYYDQKAFLDQLGIEE